MSLPRAFALVLALCALALAAPAFAATRGYLIAIGNNVAPSEAPEETLPTLRYADDDAAAFARLGREAGIDVTLLTVLDADSRRRFPELTSLAEPPTLAVLRRTVSAVKKRIEADLANGDEPALIFFYSGHGSITPNAPPSLALLDEPLTRTVLYDDVLAELPARYVHVIVDACHAEAVVRPRDGRAEAAAVTPQDIEAYETENTLRRFPEVGAVIATSSDADAHEWDVYQHGVFSYQVLSALRGAADTNVDGKIEYSELYAFLGAANAQVTDPRARLRVLVKPPPVNPSAPILDTSAARVLQARLEGPSPRGEPLYVEDERGDRLLELRPEPGFRFSLTLPSDQVLFVRTGRLEAKFRAKAGERVNLATLRLAPPVARSRGALEVSLARGLFATEFGPTYYRGFVDARPDLPPVGPSPLPPVPATDAAATRDTTGPRSTTGAVIAFGTAGVLAATSIVAGVGAVNARSSYDATDVERQASEARHDFYRNRGIAIGTGIGAGVLAAVGVFLLLEPKHEKQVLAGLRVARDRAEISARLRW
jgi:hypothetical protein